MLQDKTQSFLNRLSTSKISAKTNNSNHLFCQNIRNPYLAQLKIFQDRLKNPKRKCRSMIMRKKKSQIDINKENFEKEIKKFHEEDCLKQAKKFLLLKNKQKCTKNNQNNEQNDGFFSILPFNTIGDQIQQKTKQNQVINKIKGKLNELKLIKIMSNTVDDRKRTASFNYLQLASEKHFSQIQIIKTEAGSAIGSQRKTHLLTKTNTGNEKFQRKKNFEMKGENKISKPKVSLTFINYKKTKSLMERFSKETK